MSAAGQRWAAAVRDASSVLSDLDETELAGASFEDKPTWRLVEILLEQMPGRAIPFEDRPSIIASWRKVLVVGQEGQREVELRLASGDVADEDDTPGGVLPLVEGNNSLRSEWGMFYRLPKDLLEVLELTVSEDEEDFELDDGVDDGAGLNLGKHPRRVPAGVGAGVAAEAAEAVEDVIQDKMRLLWKEKPVTLRTREGTGDTAIAGTKVRLLGSTPASFEMVLRSDIEAGIQSGEATVLTESNDPEMDHPADVLRGDRTVIGTLFCQINWPFAGGVRVCVVFVCARRAVSCL